MPTTATKRKPVSFADDRSSKTGKVRRRVVRLSRRAPNRSSRRLIRLLIVAFIAGLMAASLAIEIMLQAIERTPLWQVLPFVEPILGQPDPDLVYILTPRAVGIWPHENRAVVEINALGLRDSPMTLEKPSGIKRIGLLGDSVTEALQVHQSQTFEALVENRLRETGLNIEIANLAMSGQGPLLQLTRLKKSGWRLNLDAVVAIANATQFLSNELLDDSVFPGYVETDTGELSIGHKFRNRRSVRYANTWFGRAFIAAYQHSILFRMLYLKSRKKPALLFSLNTATRIETPRSEQVAARSSDCVPISLRTLHALWLDREPPRNWKATRQLFDDIGAAAATHGVPVAYALRGIPLALEACEESKTLRSETVTKFREELRRRNIAFVDWRGRVNQVLGGSPNETQLSNLHGFGMALGRGHLNHQGHQVFAKVLAHVVSELIPSHSSANR